MNEILSTSLILVILIVVFLIGRQFFTWYWKINKLIEQQDEQIYLLRIIAKVDPGKKENFAESETEKKARLYDEKFKGRE